MLTRYKGVDVNPHTVHNLIRTIVNKQSSTNDNDNVLRSIIFSFRPDLSKSLLSTDNLLIRILKDCNKKEITYNYKYETNNHDEQHVAATTSPPSDIFIKMWRLNNVDREEACVVAAAVRDLCYAVLKNYDPNYDPDNDSSAATLLKLCTEVRYTKQYAYEESQAMNREMQDLEKELLNSRARVAELLATFSNSKSEWEKESNVAWETKQKSENEVARLEYLLLERNQVVDSLQTNIVKLTDKLNDVTKNYELVTREHMECGREVENLTSTIKEQASRIQYLEEQSKNAEDSINTRLVLLEKEHAEIVRVIKEKHALKVQELDAKLSMLNQTYLQQVTFAEELQQRVRKAEEQNLHMQAQIIDARTTTSTSQTDLDNMRVQLNNTSKDNALLQSKIKKLESINNQDAESNAELQSVNQKLKKENDKILLQLDTQTKKCDDLQKDLDTALKEIDDNTDESNRTYNLQKGEINRLQVELNSASEKLTQLTKELSDAQIQIDDQHKTIEYCNYEIRALSNINNAVVDGKKPKLSPRGDKKSVTSPVIKPETSKKSKLPIKHKLDTHNENLTQKIAKRPLTWDVNKLYGVKTQADLDKLIAQIKVTNSNNKDWPVYNKFLSCTNVEFDKLKDNPEYQGLDDNFKNLLIKQREFVDPIEPEQSLFSK
ncbi:desmoplakin [Helicoverpa armigera granulovirus]|uniref:Desmoplakin n=1 Tax=Helicoverpa armigera granulovirus TaxID=489830 RepID=A9YMX7_9BBAC|nr:desmoplakin [Helicoverpa armigera granulovirus]ABY47826.1 desmoplakin [Helicoverpa armigera granulovirus]